MANLEHSKSENICCYEVGQFRCGECRDSSQDAGPLRPLIAGAESTQFSSRDLYGTEGDRLPIITSDDGKRLERLALLNSEIACRFILKGNAKIASDFAASAAHFGRIALMREQVA